MEMLDTLSDTKVLEDLTALSARENEVTCEILLYLIEVDNRKLYLEQGYGSLFDYCTRALGYSEPAAMRRITAARCSRDYPGVYQRLKEKKLTLSSISVFSSVLSKENVQSVLEAVCGKSKREVELYVSGFRPAKRIVQSIKPVSVEIPHEAAPSFTFSGECGDHVQSSQLPAVKSVETRYKISFSVQEPVMKKLRVAQALSSKGHELSELFEAMLDNYIESKRAKRTPARKNPDLRTRYISKATKEEVFQRDDHRCAYVAPNGTRCASRIALEVDHIHPFSKGGSRDIQNLRCLCSQHNRLMAEKELGREFMQKFSSKEIPFPGSAQLRQGYVGQTSL